MRVAILHDALDATARPDELDAVVQAQCITDALTALGHRPWIRPATLDLAELQRHLIEEAPDVVFNLVESLDGKGRLIHLVPALLEAMGIPFTGNGATAILQTSDKPLTKEWMRHGGIPTAPWQTRTDLTATTKSPTDTTKSPTDTTKILFDDKPDFPYPATCILKPVWEDASIAIDDSAVMHVTSRQDLAAAFARRESQCGVELFAEQFIDGREFNLSLLADGDSVRVLPPAEIEFRDFPTDKPRIVGYAAKWHDASFECINTVRTFDSTPRDVPLHDTLAALARRCWDAFALRGYARVDFRVDPNNNPWALEVNANPCLTPDAGFMAAARQAELSYESVVDLLLTDALHAHDAALRSSRPRERGIDTLCSASDASSTT